MTIHRRIARRIGSRNTNVARSLRSQFNSTPFDDPVDIERSAVLAQEIILIRQILEPMDLASRLRWMRWHLPKTWTLLQERMS